MMNTRRIIAELRPTGFGPRPRELSPTEKGLMLALVNTSIRKDNDDDILDAASMMMQTVEYFAPSQWQNVQDFQFGKNEYSLTFDDLFKKAPKAWWGGKFVYGH